MQRLLELLYYLLEVKETTAKELSQYFEVSLRTIYRDLDRLIVAGIPIQTRQGKNGGVSIDSHYILDKYILNDLQQEDILTALKTLQALNLENDESLSKQLQLHFHKDSTNWIDIDLSTWHETVSQKEKFDCLKNAIIKRQYIIFEYINLKNYQTIKKIQPLQLVFKGQAWYLRGFDILKNEERIYKLSRMKKIELLQETFPLKTIQSFHYQYHQLYEKIDATLLFDSVCGSFVYDEFQDEDITLDNGCYLVQIQLYQTPWLISTLLSFGHHLKIIQPESLKKQLLKEIKRIETIYE